MAEVGRISFGLSIDTGKIMASVMDASKKINTGFTKSFEKVGSECQKSCNKMAEDIQKISPEVDQARIKIDSILTDSERSAKSKASAIAWVYRKQGMDQSEAMKKAWTEIERSSRKSSGKVKQNVKGIGQQSQKTAKGMSIDFLGAFKKIAAGLVSAFAVKQIVAFGKECLELGSDLQEVQNVVDVTFPKMNARVNEFAQSAASSFGLSETMAKKFTGTFGAMAKAFGFSEEQAYDMSTALTGLAGDVASFYNITKDESYTKLKSVFTGETESLKDLGIVMTQSALDSYALANGFGKTTKAMTEAEKVALRYQFVQEQLTGATGDFIRTSDGWANQVRVLRLQFDSLKATIGQGLINVLTPVIKVINALVGRLMVLANAFKSFTEMFSGKKADGQTDSINSTAKSAMAAAGAVEGIGDAAAASAKKMKGLAAFDNLNTLQDKAVGGGSGASVSPALPGIPNAGEAASAVENSKKKLQGLIDKAKELLGLFREGFFTGLGDTAPFDRIEESLDKIKDKSIEVFTSPKLARAAEQLLDSVVENTGKSMGAFLSIGASAADNLITGISGYLEKESGRISDYLVDMLRIGKRMSEISGDVSAMLANVAGVLRSEGAVRITESLVGAFSNAFMDITKLCGQLVLDLVDTITKPILENQDLIRAAAEETLSTVAPVFESLRDTVDECFTVLNGTYVQHIQPMLQSFRDGMTELGRKALELYQSHILPAVEGMSERFLTFKEQYLSPLIEKFGEFSGKVTGAVTAVWENCLQPFLNDLMEFWAPVIGTVLEGVWGFFVDCGAVISEVIDSVMEILGGLLDFIQGVFSGDWKLAWQGIKDFFVGIWDAMQNITDSAVNAIWNLIKSVLNTINSFFQEKWTNIKKISSQALEDIKRHVSDTFNGIFTVIYSVVTKISKVWGEIWSGMRDALKGILGGIQDIIKNAINGILGGVEAMTNGFIDGINGMIAALNRIQVNIPDWVPLLGGKSFGISLPQIGKVSIPRLAQGGYVKPNTPQLAMIGDNRHQGEIVAPEDKIYQISVQAMRDVMQQFMSMILSMQSGKDQNITIVLRVTGEMAPLVRLLKTELDKEQNRTGINFEVVYE